MVGDAIDNAQTDEGTQAAHQAIHDARGADGTAVVVAVVEAVAVAPSSPSAGDLGGCRDGRAATYMRKQAADTQQHQGQVLRARERKVAVTAPPFPALKHTATERKPIIPANGDRKILQSERNEKRLEQH